MSVEFLNTNYQPSSSMAKSKVLRTTTFENLPTVLIEWLYEKELSNLGIGAYQDKVFYYKMLHLKKKGTQ